MASILNWKSRGIKVRPPSGSGSGRGTLSTFTSLKFLTILAKKRQRVVFATVSPKHFRFPENNDGSKIGWKDLEKYIGYRALKSSGIWKYFVAEIRQVSVGSGMILYQTTSSHLEGEKHIFHAFWFWQHKQRERESIRCKSFPFKQLGNFYRKVLGGEWRVSNKLQ